MARKKVSRSGHVETRLDIREFFLQEVKPSLKDVFDTYFRKIFNVGIEYFCDDKRFAPSKLYTIVYEKVGVSHAAFLKNYPVLEIIRAIYGIKAYYLMRYAIDFQSTLFDMILNIKDVYMGDYTLRRLNSDERVEYIQGKIHDLRVEYKRKLKALFKN